MIAGIALHLITLPGVVIAQPIEQSLWITNGPVYCVLSTGTRIYIGGQFSYVGPATGSGVPLDLTTGEPTAIFPQVIGIVRAVVPDGAGGWYIGGRFSSVGGFPRSNIAHVASDLSVSAWNPNASGSDPFGFENELGVYALAPSGTTVYVGGYFSYIGGQQRTNIAALDAITGAATTWNPGLEIVPGFELRPTVRALALSGSTVYVGGSFTLIGGQGRNGLAALDMSTGAATQWNPNVSPHSHVHALAVSGSAVYAGGSLYITDMAGLGRANLAAVDRSTGAVLDWRPDPNNRVFALALGDSMIYVGGEFDVIGGQVRHGLAAVDLSTGRAASWIANANSSVLAMAVSGRTLYVGGVFTSIAGEERRYLAVLDALTGAAYSGDPRVGGIVLALAVNDEVLYLGGIFSSVGGNYRTGIAALDAATGAATPWNPLASGPVKALAVSDTTVYAGGEFSVIGGKTRFSVAALSATSGEATAWNPDPWYNMYRSPQIDVLVVRDSTVYVAGVFSRIGGQPRNNAAALNIETGRATAWNPNANSFIYTLAANPDVIFAGGRFSNVGGLERSGIAALDLTTGAATAWNPHANGAVNALTVDGTKLYAGGDFTTIGGQQRRAVAALDVETGAATEWDPNAGPGASVHAIATSGNTVYVGGQFASIGGQERNNLASIDDATGIATSWNPDPIPISIYYPRVWPELIHDLAVTGATLHVGGVFSAIDGLPHSHLAAFSDVATGTLVSLVSAHAEPGFVRLTWLAGVERDFRAVVFRRTRTNAWSVVGNVVADGTGRLVYEDSQVDDGTRYGYRLGVVQRGVEEFLGETWVDVPNELEFGLAGLRPNPASEGLRAAFSLPDAAPARLEVLDLAGRRLIAKEVGALGRGTHLIDLAPGRVVPPGVYLMRLSRAGRSLTARAVVVR